MALSEIQTQVMEVYIATFNRAPDAAGLDYWVNTITSNNWDVEDVATSMLESNEAQSIYSTNLSNTDFINSIYQNALGRNSDAQGLAYWEAQLQAGIPKTSMILAIINGAKSATGSIDDKQFLSNKKTVAEYFTFTKSLNDVNLAKSAISYITLDSETINLAEDKIDLFEYIKNDIPFVTNLDDNVNSLTTFEENDIIFSWSGNDIISAGGGDNYVVSGLGNDIVYSADGNDTIKLREGNDTTYSGDGDDTIHGNSGDDNIHGQEGDDIIYGNEEDDNIYGEDGADILYGGLGNDFINGGIGDDTIYGNEGDDIIYAEDGENFVDGSDGNDIIYGGINNDFLYGGTGDDNLYAGEGNDIIDGLAEDDVIYSGLGDDITFGSAGDDIIYGNEGNDTIDGGVGVDKIYGELGKDILTGGQGKDTFYFSLFHSNLTSLDTITDFEFSLTGNDKLVLINQGSESINLTKLNVSSATTLADAANLASLGDGSTDAIFNWFIFADNTYILEDLSASLTFDGATDVIIKLQGIVDLTGINSYTVTFA